MLLGYARVSTTEKDTAAQVATLKTADSARLFKVHPASVLRLLTQVRFAMRWVSTS